VSRFLTAHQHNLAIQCHSRRYTMEIQHRRQIKNRHTTKTKHNPGKANNAIYSRTKLAWFSRLIRHLARKRGGLMLQRTQGKQVKKQSTAWQTLLRHRISV